MKNLVVGFMLSLLSFTVSAVPTNADRHNAAFNAAMKIVTSAKTLGDIIYQIPERMEFKKISIKETSHNRYDEVKGVFQYPKYEGYNSYLGTNVSLMFSMVCQRYGGKAWEDHVLDDNRDIKDGVTQSAWSCDTKNFKFRYFVLEKDTVKDDSRIVTAVVQVPKESTDSQWLADAITEDFKTVREMSKLTGRKVPFVPQKFSARNTAAGPRIWDLTLNKTRLNELSSRCFYKEPPKIPVDDTGNKLRIGARLSVMPFFTEGEVFISAENERLSNCYGPGIVGLSLSLANDKLSYINFESRPELNLKPKILAGLGLTKQKQVSANEEIYQGKDFTLSWYRTQDLIYGLPVDSFTFRSNIPQKHDKEYLKKYGYPKYGPFRLGKSTKKELAPFMKTKNFQQSDWDKRENKYFAVFDLLPFGRQSPKNFKVGYRIRFDEKDILREVEITFFDAVTKEQVESYLGNDFIYIGKTDSQLLFFKDGKLDVDAEHQDDYVYWHKKYVQERTKGHSLFTAHVRHGRKTGHIYSMTLSSW